MICPTRGRPANAVDLWEAWQDTSTGAAELCFAVDVDDPKLPAYNSAFQNMTLTEIYLGPRRGMVGTLNHVAAMWASGYRYLGFLGDDHRPRTHGWDARFVEVLESNGPRIVYGDDLLQGQTMPTAVAMTSDIVATLGYMAPSTMQHLCVDVVWKDWGQQLGRLTYLSDVILEHLHPANGKAQMDAGYEAVNSSEQVERDSKAYLHYRDCGGLEADVAKLRMLL